MTSFKFPPPPPPPPKTSSESHRPDGGQRYGHHNRGRGGGGRGGGHVHIHEHKREEYGHGRGGHFSNRGGSRRGSSHPGHRQQQCQASPLPANTLTNVAPAMAYVHPNLMAQSQLVDPNSLVQAMSFMATPAGQQSMAAFAHHMANTGNAAHSAPPKPRYSPPRQAGHKRKFSNRDNQPMQQQGSKPPRVKAAVPPPIPHFGFSLPPPPVSQAPATAKAKGKKEQDRRKPQLGLTPHPLLEDSSEGEEIDEEAAYATKLKDGGFVFEHEGEQVTIRTAAEVAAWIKDRRKNFPTQKRIVEKAEASAVRRAVEIEFLRKLKGKRGEMQPLTSLVKAKKVFDGNKKDKRRQEDETQKQQELAELRKKLHESMVQKQKTVQVVDLGLGYDSETGSEQSSILSASSVVSSSDEWSEGSGCESSEDEGPESMGTKVGPQAIKIPRPAPSVVLPAAKTKEQVCQSWARHGRCSYSHKCKFAHPVKETQRPGLYEVMVEQELVKADQMALEAIKYLGQHGFLG